MIYAVNTGLIDVNPASGIGMAFEKTKKTKHAYTSPGRTTQANAFTAYV